MSETMSNTESQDTKTVNNTKTIPSTESTQSIPEHSEETLPSDFESSQPHSTETEDESDVKIPQELQVKIGKVLTAERRKERAKSEAQIADLRNQVNLLQQTYSAPQSNNSFNSTPSLPQPSVVQDPISKQYYAVDTEIGQSLLREQQHLQLQQQRQAALQAAEQQKKIDSLEEKLIEAKMKYNDFDKSVEAFGGVASIPMANALLNTDIPTSIINYLGTNPEELNRFKQLSPEKQVKELYKLEDKLAGSNRKLSTSAKPPINGIDASRNTGATRETQSFEARRAELLEKYWKG